METTIACSMHEAISGLQTEIIMFILAIILHGLFFGKLRMPRKGAGKNFETQKVTGDNAPKARRQHAQKLAQVASSFCEGRSASKCIAQLSAEMETVPPEDTLDALAGFLEGAGKNSTLELCGAVHEILRTRGLELNVDLGELLLRNYHGLRLTQAFDAVFDELQATHGMVPSVGVLAIKDAVRAGNLEACLARLNCLQHLWGRNGGPTTTDMKLLQQVTRLAANEQSVIHLLQRLQQLGILQTTIDTMICDLARSSDAKNLAVVLQFAKDHRVRLGELAHVAMIEKAGSSKDALKWFMDAVALKLPMDEILKAVSGWALLHGDVSLVEAVIKKLPANPPAEAVGNILHVYAEGKAAVSAPSMDADAMVLKMYTEKFHRVDLSSDVRAMRLVTQAALRSERHNRAATSVLPGMFKLTSEQAQVNLMKSFGQDKDLVAVLAVLHASPVDGARLYNVALESCVDCKSLDDAKRIMSEAVHSGVADGATYNAMMKAYLQAKRPRDARKTVEAMKAAGFPAICASFNDVLEPIVKTRAEDAWVVVEEMRASGVQPNRITCSILLKAVQPNSKGLDIEYVLSVIDEMEEALDSVLLCAVVDTCIRVGRSDLLMPHIKKQQRLASVQARCSHTYGSIIRAYGAMHDTVEVWNTWREMRTRHIPASAITLGCMVEALASNNEVEAAYELINDMLRDDQWGPLVNAVIYCSVLKGFSHQKRFDRMWAVYTEMLTQKLQFSIVTFNTLVDACSRNGEMGRIPALLADMVAQGIVPNIITYSAIVKGYCQANRIEEAFSVLDQMVQTTTFKPDEIMYNSLIDGCARQGLYDRGVGVLTEMIDAGIAPTNFTLSVVVKLAQRSQRLDKAFEFCQEIAARYKLRLNVHVYDNLINACIAGKEIDRACQVFEKMLSERVRPDARTYTLLLRACLANKKVEDAVALLRAAVGLPTEHHWFCKRDRKFLQLQAGLSSGIVTEILEGIAFQCNDEVSAVSLLRDLRRVSTVKLDSKFQIRMAATASSGKAACSEALA